MAECRIGRFNHPFHTFLTKRFDRIGTARLHFTSALTQLGYYDGDYEASYLEIAQFLTQKGADTKADLPNYGGVWYSTSPFPTVTTTCAITVL